VGVVVTIVPFKELPEGFTLGKHVVVHFLPRLLPAAAAAFVAALLLRILSYRLHGDARSRRWGT
jgi:hypothetical protein